MSAEPTGDIRRTSTGRDLILTRALPIPVDESWAWITESPRLEKWFGTWTGTGEPGGKIRVTMTHEEGDATSDGEILSCDPGNSYAVRVINPYGDWHLELAVAETVSGSRVTFVQHLDGDVELGQIAAGWEYYLDFLVAAVGGKAEPDFDDYWPSMGPYYAERD